MYKVFKVTVGNTTYWQVFYCPDAPISVVKKIPYDGKLYNNRQGAYRRCAGLEKQRLERQAKEREAAVAASH